MAIDTALKRGSAINVFSPWRAILPLPDGSVDQADRQVVALAYSGISAGEVAPEPEPQPQTPIVGGGDDVPRHHPGWDKKEYDRKLKLDLALQQDIRSIYRKLRGIPELKAKAENVVKPFTFDGNFPSANNIDWAYIQQSAEIQLRMMWIERQRLIEEEEMPVVMEILSAIL